MRWFVSDFGAKLGRRIEDVPSPTLEKLAAYHWSEDVRELENVVERVMLLSAKRFSNGIVADCINRHEAVR